MSNSRSMGTALMAYTRFILDIVADSVEKSRRSEVVANLPNTNDIFDFTLIAAANDLGLSPLSQT